MNWNTAAGAWAIARAAGEVISTNIGSYVDYRATTQPAGNYPSAAARVVNAASQPTATAPASKTTTLLLLLLIGLIIGIALAFLVEYLDDRIRSTTEVTRLLQLPVYGEVPPAPVSVQRKRLGT